MYEQIELLGLMCGPLRRWINWCLPWDSPKAAKNNKIIDALLEPMVHARQSQSPQEPSRDQKPKRTVTDLFSMEAPASKDLLSLDEKSSCSPCLLANIKAFIYAGHDTTASTACFLVKYLLDNPDCLVELRAEHDETFGTASSPEDVLDILRTNPHLLNKLPYTLGTIKETLRLCPIVATMREAEPDLRLRDPFSGREYPVGGFALWVSPPGIHRNPNYYEQPSKFEPKRWIRSDDNPVLPAKEAWVPFSYGGAIRSHLSTMLVLTVV